MSPAPRAGTPLPRTPEQRADPLNGPLMLLLRNLLRAELAQTLSGPVARTSLVWDALVPPTEDCLCQAPEGQGEAWVRLARIDPQVAVNQRGIIAGSGEGCPPDLTATLELGVMRCHPQRGKQTLSEQEQTDITLLRLSDVAALRRVVECGNLETLRRGGVPPPRLSLGTLLPVGPQGACSGVVLSVQAAFTGRRANC